MRAEPLVVLQQSSNQANLSAPVQTASATQTEEGGRPQLSPFGQIYAAERRLNFEPASELTSCPEGSDGKTAGKEVCPTVTWGAAAAKGLRHDMEDAHMAVSNVENLPECSPHSQATSFFAVFDGHGGSTAAVFGAQHLLRLVVNNEFFAENPGHAMNYAFQELDEKFYKEVEGEEPPHCSGSTVLAALLQGPQLMVANAGDSRAVICKRGRAEDLSRDHRPALDSEQERVERCGGYFSEGYLNGHIGVTRGIGDFHLDTLKQKQDLQPCFTGPLTAEPEIQVRTLTTEDEFVILACDGLWDKFPSQRVIELARQNLQQNDNNAQKCAEYLVKHSLDNNASDNVTVLVVCLTSEAPPKRFTAGELKRSVSQNGFSTLKSALHAANT